MLALFLMVVASNARAQERGRVYLDPKDSFANEFAAGADKKHFPLILTADSENVNYTAQFSWQTNEGSKTMGVMTTLATGIYMNGSFERVSMTILEAKSRNIVYSYTCQKGGRHLQSAAECLAKHWRNDIQDHPEKWARIPEAVSVKVVEAPILRQQPGTENRTIQSPGVQGVTITPVASEMQIMTGPVEESLGDAARRARAEKEKQQQTPKQ